MSVIYFSRMVSCEQMNSAIALLGEWGISFPPFPQRDEGEFIKETTRSLTKKQKRKVRKMPGVIRVE